MSARHGVLAAVFVFIVGFALLTAIDLIRNGVTPMLVVALVVLGFVAVGVLGAFASPPRR